VLLALAMVKYVVEAVVVEIYPERVVEAMNPDGLVLR
jgi:hypothetical protein